MKIRHFKHSFWRVTSGICLFGFSWQVLANPTGMTVQSGSANLSASGPQLTITTSQSAFLNWQSFNIAAGETTIFNQPSANSVVINNIHDANASQIYGGLQANGMVVLMNSSGFYFGPNAFIKTGGLIVSTANCIPPQNSGGAWQFNGPPPLASIVNYGQIQVGNGGSAFLIADKVENHGDIEAPGGSVGLASGQTVLLSERPDGRGMSMEVTLPKGSVNNYGTIVADGGTIAMNARVVNQDGFVQANSVRDHDGTIELVAADQLTLGENSRISARGDDTSAGSSGGNVTLQSGNDFSDNAGSRIDVSGGTQGGNGGNIEISAPNVLSLNSSMDAHALAGWRGGEFFLDPVNIVLGTSSANGMVNINTAFAGFSQILLQASGDITLSANTAWDLTASSGQSSGQLTLEAGNNIIFQDGSSISDGNNWSVNLAAGYNFVNNAVQSGTGNIYLNGGSGMAGGGLIQTANGGINLAAGQDITVGSGYVITTGGGSISAHALAGDIDTGSDAQGYHFVNNAGSLNAVYNLNNGLGGISTAAGGDVTLIAGGDVRSVLPGKGIFYYDGNQVTPDNGNDYLTAGSGAYGRQPGNVTVVVGGNVTGHYLVANGTGGIFAGVQMDANGNPIMDSSGHYAMGATGNAGANLSDGGLALSLINGGWNVAAAHNIILQEVRNPNGTFNGGSSFNHTFDYAPADFVNLSAGNQVQLGASISLPRLTGANNNVPIIYPSILNITAGAGGVILGAPGFSASLVLFPSPQGSLTINTVGSLVNALNAVQGSPQLFNLIVSDAGHSQFTTTANFGVNDHAATPVHLSSPTPIELNIGGDMNLINLVVPEAAQINVGGNMLNCGFQGMNLSPAPTFQVQVPQANGNPETVTVDPGVTTVNVTGDILDRSAFTSIELGQIPGAEAPDLSVLARALNNNLSLSAVTLAKSFYYNPATGTLTYQNIPGTTLLSVLNLLNNLPVQEFINGVPQWENPPSAGGDPPYNTIPLPAPNNVSLLGNPSTPGTIAYALVQQYNALGVLPLNASTYGYTIGGGGQFNLTARTIDLGTSAGIQSQGVALYTVRGSNPYPLAGLFGNGGVFNHGTDINLITTGNPANGKNAAGNLIGDLDMYSTSIASLNGGNISISASGDVNAGSPVFTVNSVSPLGIYTSQGDVSVTANGDINVNGSRIAAYDGGNVTVESLHGNIDAGTGVNGFVAVKEIYEDPVTHQVYTTTEAIPGSGFLATTYPPPLPGSVFPAPLNNVGNILVETPEGSITTGLGGIIQTPLNGLDSPDAVVEVLAGYELRDANGNRVLARSIATGTAVPVFSARNVVTLGPIVQVTPAGSITPVSLTQVLDGNGNPLLDPNGQPLYVKTQDASRQIVQLVNNRIQPYLDFHGSAASVTEPLDANGQPFNDSQGNPVLVLGRKIDTGSSGIIAQNAVLKATGGIKGVIFSTHNITLDSLGPITVIALGHHIDVTGTVGPSELIGPEVNAAGADPSNIQSANANGGGSTFAKGTTANATSQAASSSDANKALASTGEGDDDDNKNKKDVALQQKVSRVTVILPAKNPPPASSQKQTSTQPL